MDIARFPLTRLTLFFITGILLSYYFPTDVRILAVFSTILVLGLILFNHFKSFNAWIGLSMCIYSIAFFTGSLCYTSRAELNDRHYTRHANYERKQIVSVVLRERLRSKPLKHRFFADVKSVDGKSSNGRILLNIAGERDLLIGTHITFNAKIGQLPRPLNPGQFDYGKYLCNKKVYGQIYLNAHQLLIHPQPEKNIWHYSDKLRKKIVGNLEKADFSKDALAVTNALILGQQQDISQEILQDYQYAGAIHILSVSGLHVGFILLFLNFLLGMLPQTRNWRLLKLWAIIFSLWGFAVIAGLSPSVIRSATMFSIIALGMYLRRSTNIFHTLIVSMLIILTIEPSFLFDVGFQLSYCALFFILWLQPILSKIWEPNNRIVKYFWNILTVSIAAQVGTLPLSVYYFHQFPGLFFLTNLAVIPFLSVVMAIGVLVMIFALFDFTPYFPIGSLEFLVDTLNHIIKWIAAHESFVIRDIPFTFSMALSAMLLSVILVMLMQKIKPWRILVALLAVICFQLAILFPRYKIAQTQELIVFHLRNNPLLAIRNGLNVILLANDTLIEKDYVLQPYLTNNFCRIDGLKPLENFIKLKEHKILIVDSATLRFPKVKPDIVVLTGSPRINLERFVMENKPEIIVADASNFKSYISRWEATCGKLKIPFHSTGEKGFFTTSL